MLVSQLINSVAKTLRKLEFIQVIVVSVLIALLYVAFRRLVLISSTMILPQHVGTLRASDYNTSIIRTQ